MGVSLPGAQIEFRSLQRARSTIRLSLDPCISSVPNLFPDTIEDNGSFPALSIEPDFQLFSVDFTGKRFCLLSKERSESKPGCGNFPLRDRGCVTVAIDRTCQGSLSRLQVQHNLHSVSGGPFPLARYRSLCLQNGRENEDERKGDQGLRGTWNSG